MWRVFLLVTPVDRTDTSADVFWNQARPEIKLRVRQLSLSADGLQISPNQRNNWILETEVVENPPDFQKR